ncbi:hypothetical protein A3H19_03735 [Candidatus Woesebacteria bacterium RIFCSPLOWO2_12_FULL_39_9]|nr:MAG: hypothetical protein A3H19_03735 [Candidatus Woesebacteria bacterium RIFCSPLOWO2_12_FULL_39_9]
MVKLPNQKPDVNLAPTKVKNSLKFALRLLALIGKPFFTVLTYIFLAVILGLHATGYFIKRLFGTVTFIFNSFFNSASKKISSYKKYLARIYSSLKKTRFFFEKKLSLKKQGDIFKASPQLITLLKGFLLKVSISSKNFGQRLLLKTTKVFVLIKQTANLSKRSYLYTEKSINLLKVRLRLIPIFLTKPKTKVKVRITKLALLKIILFSFLITVLLTILSGFLFWRFILRDLPTAQELTKRNVDVSTKIYDRNGILLYTIYDDKNRTPVELNSIPLHVRLATLAIEDAEFYSHPGFSIRGITRAALKNWRQGELTGGSTITQQLVKNALLSSEKTLIRKLREITLAVIVEMTYSKNEILEMYLNEVSYGGTAYGIEEAARTYFNKDVGSLTLNEAAILAGLPKSPTQYSPFGPNPQAAIDRKNEVLNLMHTNGFITQSQKEETQKEVPIFAENKTDIKASHFVMFVRELLEETYGKELVEKGGLNVVTTLHYNIQILAETVVKEEVDKLAKLNVRNGAAVVISPATGEVLAMVGSKDYFDTQNDGNVNVTTSLRQPGSSIKIVNYAYALSNGYTAATIIPDTPVTFLIPGLPPYTPKNYEGGFRGNLTLRSAFAESRNVPAVKVLNSYGVKNMIEMGQKMGITTWNNPDNYGLSLTLGGGEVKLLDLAYAYATIANYGKKPEEKYILKITNNKGKVLEENFCGRGEASIIAITYASSSGSTNSEETSKCDGNKVIDPRVAYIITDILKDNNARTPAFGTNSLLVIPNHKEVAVKTGTSNNLRDNLTLGYNQTYLVATWVGNNDNSEMARIASGVTGASPIFNKIMSSLLQTEENHDWTVPEDLVQVPICTITGTLSCNGCPTRLEWFLKENAPQKACSPEWFKKDEENKPTEEVKNNQPEIQYHFFDQPKPKKRKFLFDN